MGNRTRIFLSMLLVLAGVGAGLGIWQYNQMVHPELAQQTPAITEPEAAAPTAITSHSAEPFSDDFKDNILLDGDELSQDGGKKLKFICKRETNESSKGDILSKEIYLDRETKAQLVCKLGELASSISVKIGEEIILPSISHYGGDAGDLLWSITWLTRGVDGNLLIEEIAFDTWVDLNEKEADICKTKTTKWRWDPSTKNFLLVSTKPGFDRAKIPQSDRLMKACLDPAAQKDSAN